MPDILITKKYPNEIIEPLEKIARVHQWDQHKYDLMPRSEILKVVSQMTAIINQGELKVDKELLESGNRLKIVANVSLGFDNLDLDLMTHYKVWASNTPGHFAYPVVEYIIGGIIAINRRLLEADRFVRNGEWNSFQPGRWDGQSLTHKTLGIIGMGGIGQSLAQLASCLGMKIIYFNQSKKTNNFTQVSLEDLFAQADVISLNVPHTHQTHEMITAAQLSQMKPGAIFVNTARGKVVKEEDLIHFLENGHLGGAVIDVFAQEPFVPEALKKMPNVLLSPHLAGGTKKGRIECYKLAVSNVIEVMQGKQPLHPLNQIN